MNSTDLLPDDRAALVEAAIMVLAEIQAAPDRGVELLVEAFFSCGCAAAAQVLAERDAGLVPVSEDAHRRLVIDMLAPFVAEEQARLALAGSDAAERLVLAERQDCAVLVLNARPYGLRDATLEAVAAAILARK